MVSLDVTVGRTEQQEIEDDARGRKKEERKRETGWIGYSVRLAVIFMY